MATEITRSSEYEKPPMAITARGLNPTNFDELWRMAKAVATSGLAPRGLDTPEKAFVAMAHGLEIGFKPMQSMQRIAVINGRPTIYGDAMIGLVRASGQLERFSETFEGKEGGNDFRAVCVAKRRGADEVRSEFSIGDAKTGGLWGKSGPWTTSPKRMLQMRARAFTLRDLFADVLGGLYMAEEIQDDPAFGSGSVVDDRSERLNVAVRKVANEASPPKAPQIARDEPETVEADTEPPGETDAGGGVQDDDTVVPSDTRPHPDMDPHRGPPIDPDDLMF